MTTWTTAPRQQRDWGRGVTVTLRIAQPVCDDANYSAELGWRLAGIIGNEDHWRKRNSRGELDRGDHTSDSRDVGRAGMPLSGWVYAVDVAVPASWTSRVETAILALARAGRLPQLKYFNISGRHWSWRGNFARSTRSGDQHLHISYERGHETTTGRSVLRAAVAHINGEPEEDFMSALTPAEQRAMRDTLKHLDWVLIHRGGAWSLVRGMAAGLQGIAQIQATLGALQEQVRAVAERTGMTPEQLAALEAMVRDAVGDGVLTAHASALVEAAEALTAAAAEPAPAGTEDA